jgi:hypothetical protein
MVTLIWTFLFITIFSQTRHVSSSSVATFFSFPLMGFCLAMAHPRSDSLVLESYEPISFHVGLNNN